MFVSNKLQLLESPTNPNAKEGFRSLANTMYQAKQATIFKPVM